MGENDLPRAQKLSQVHLFMTQVQGLGIQDRPHSPLTLATLQPAYWGYVPSRAEGVARGGLGIAELK